MKRIVTIVVLCLFLGAVGGYGAGYIIYIPKIKSYEIQVSNLTSEVSKLKQTISNQETRISTQVAQIYSLESQKSDLQTKLDGAQAQAQAYREQVTNLMSELSDSQERLNRILEIRVTQSYQWFYGWQTWQWELPIPLSVYVEYLEKQRPQSEAYYVDMAKDPRDDLYIDQMVQKINEATLQAGFTEVQKLNFVIAFVQSLPYTVDKETTPYDEYPRYPIETLFDRGGDCEDSSILVAALLDRLNYDVALILLRNAQHMAVGVSLVGTYGSYYNYDGKMYFYLETTGEDWQIGEIPPDITDTTGYIYPLRS